VKRLTLVRHGHAEARAEGGDFYRALSAQGRSEIGRAAAAMGACLPPPDSMLASDAQRTRETAQLLQEHFRSVTVVETSKALYHASSSTLLEVIQNTPKSVQHLLLVGHNPGLSELALRWARRFEAHADFGGFATAGWCSVTFDTDDWSLISSPLDAVFG
jgi:phosphohistidine phosphatase